MIQNTSVTQNQRNQHATDTAVTIEERMDRFKLDMGQCRFDQRRSFHRVIVQEFFKSPMQLSTSSANATNSSMSPRQMKVHCQVDAEGNSACNSGAGAGNSVFLRVSYGSDGFATGWDAYNLTTRNAGLEGDAPVISFTASFGYNAGLTGLISIDDMKEINRRGGVNNVFWGGNRRSSSR